MEQFSVLRQPMPVHRPRGAHRFEVFSPRLNRRITFTRRSILEQWVLLEADARVVEFCERPGFVQTNGNRREIDFWARYADLEELILVADSMPELGRPAIQSSSDLDQPIRFVPAAELAAAKIWIDNWHRILPCIIATRGLVPQSFLDRIPLFLSAPRRLLDIQTDLSKGDPILVRAACFHLLHSGRIEAPSLHTQELSALTEFRLAGHP